MKPKVSKIAPWGLVVIVVFAICGLCAKLAYRKYQALIQFKESTIINNSILAEMMSERMNCQLDTLPHDVLCIGNSITLHAPLDDVNWYSNQGMAASKPEYDYVHMLEKMMQKNNPNSTVIPVNLALWERDFSANIDSLLKDKCEGKDIIVIRLGENVPTADIPQFAEALSGLIDYCSQYTENIVLTGLYWPVPEKERAVVLNAHKYNLKYVPLYWIWNLYNEECTPSEGDTLYDTVGNPYQITGDFILTHPNDKGMALIARSIYNAL